MPTIKDVAKLSGISRSTVSRVINNHPYVNDEKRMRVKQAMKELGYVPNSSAQRLRGSKTKTIAVLISRIVNPFFSGLVDAMDEVATEAGFQLILCNTRGSKERELNYLDLLRTKQVDGVVLASIENPWTTIQPYLAYGPIVSCNEYTDQSDIPSFRINHFQATYEAVTHFINSGYSNIAICTGDETIGSNLGVDREKGYLKALSDHHMTPNEAWFFKNTSSVLDGRKVLERIEAMSNRPNAIYTGSDEVAMGIIAQSKQSAIRVPSDLAVIGFDDQQLAGLITPGLTTIRQPILEMGQRTMHHMIRILTNQTKMDGNTHLLLSELIVRDTS
ncbi:LacI family DNA-binding transcriptional regulator [Alkalicoccobacillus murimartini]|uniref:DNA-binding LacI/PurR family transcriptional regulator n=1 Tax=Alkalicoccobacillus murimartini TaxID=171685 RepID=A0ABT9YC39_9BACI|nr:LacI family DNA-binding transcriptional regulator [Alkalicoccobacillus murimartini]MDQ0205414.1 DNA-binding LacI/PurR family transcriptional regulator [Alkalicoccobacillus murimartini]